MLDLSRRAQAEEQMDDFTITDARLCRALEDLRLVNRWLGGYAAARAALHPLLREAKGRRVRILDLGTGIADIPEHIVRWSDRHGADVEVVAVDANPATVDYAVAALDRRLPPHLRRRIRVVVGDALALSFADDACDVAMAALFMHHLEHEAAVTLLRGMRRVARQGILVQDLHRHRLAYYGIVALAGLLPVSAMFQHDGPLSVRRGFRRSELQALAEAAGLEAGRIYWRWAFRWVLTTL